MLKRKMLITTIWIATLFFLAIPALAEMIVDTAWVRSYNGPANDPDWAVALAVDISGNVHVTGGGAFRPDYVTLKYYSNGDTAWVRTYNGPGDGWDVATGIAVDDSSNVYVTGFSEDSTTHNDYATVKYYPNGDTGWVRRYDGPASLGDYAHAITVDDSGYVYVLTIKYHLGGDTAWVRRYDGPGSSNDIARAIAVDGLGNVYVTGASKSRESFEDYATIKYLANGDTAWVRRYDGPAYLRDEAFSIDVDGSGNVCVTGWSWNGTDYDYATIKYYPDGDTAWVRRYHGPEHLLDSAPSVATDELGNVYVAGSSRINEDDCDYLTIKYSPNGDMAWVRRYDGPASGRDHAADLALDNIGNIYVTGVSSWDYAAVKYDSSGNEVWVRRYNGPENGSDYARAIAVDGSGFVYVTGDSKSSGSWEDFATVKYVQTGLWRGDANGDRIIDLGDLVYLINFLYKGGPAPDLLTVGDCNCDEIVNVGDVVYLVNYLFKSGDPPDC
jgi:hypothetical protein